MSGTEQLRKENQSSFCNLYLYSQNGCSFDGNFANFLRNIGIWLTVWVDQVAIRASKLLYRFRAVFKNHLKSSLLLEILTWLMMANMHYNRITRLKKGENNCLVHVWSIQNKHRSQKKLDYRLKLQVSKYWILATVNSMCIYWDITINATVAVPVAFI